MKFNKLPFIGQIIDKIWPDKDEAMKAKALVAELEQKGELAFLDAQLQVMLGQIAVNKEDAKSNSKFQSWWRPATGWICVFGLAYPIATSLLSWSLQIITWITGNDFTAMPVPPEIDTSILLTLLTGLLGLGGMRSWEKNKRHSEWREQ